MVTLPGSLEQDTEETAQRIDPPAVQNITPPEPVFEPAPSVPEPPEPVIDAPQAGPVPTTFDSVAAEMNMRYDMDLRRSLAQSMKADRTRAARAAQIAAETGEPPEIVEPRLKEYEAAIGLHRVNIDDIQKNYPTLAMFLGNELNATLTSDDITPWQRVTDTLATAVGDPIRTTLGMGLSGLGETMRAGVRYDPVREMKRADPAAGPTSVSEMLGLPYFNPTDAISKTLMRGVAEILIPIGDTIQNVGENIMAPPERTNLATQLSGALGQTAANLGLFAVQPHIATAMLFGLGAEQQSQRIETESEKIDAYLEYLGGEAARLESVNSPEAAAVRNHIAEITERRADLDDPLMQLTSLVAGGTVTGLTERFQAGLLLRKIPGMDQALAAATKGMPAFLQSKIAVYAAKIAAAGSAEAAQEVIEGLGQDIISYYAYNPHQQFFEEWETEATVGGFSGAVAQAGILYLQSLAAGGRRAHDIGQAQSGARQTAALVEDLQKTVTESKLMERNPALAGQLLQMIGQDFQKTVYLSPDVAKGFYQDGIDPTMLLAADPELAAEINRAAAAGTDIEIGVDRLVNVLAQGQGQYDFMRDYIKETADSMDVMTARRIDEDTEFANAYIREAIEKERAEIERSQKSGEAVTTGERLEQRIKDGIMLSENRAINSPDTARKYAALMRRMYETVAEATGENTALLRRLEARVNALSVRGVRRLVLKPDAMDVQIERLRDIQKGKSKPGRRRSQYPVRNYIIKKGGLPAESAGVGSMFGAGTSGRSRNLGEIRAMGLEKVPGLIRKKGRVSLDNIPREEFAADTGLNPGQIVVDSTGYVDENWLLEQLRAEAAGNPLKSPEQIEQDAEDAAIDDLSRTMDEAGVDLKMTNAEIKAGLQRYLAQFSAEPDGVTFNQGGLVNTESEAFKRWFGDSKVVDADGKPLVVYHTTSSPVDFESFKRRLGDVGIHFGTAGQAADRADYMRGKDVKNREGAERTIPVYLSIKKPLRLDDLSFWSADNLASGLENAGFSKEEINAALRSSRSANGKLSALRDLIKRKGYDGIVYKNTGEVEGSQVLREKMEPLREALMESQRARGKSLNSFDREDQQTPEYKAYGEAQQAEAKFREENGEDSWIALDPTQIKSVHNRGTFDPNDARILYQDNAAAEGLRSALLDAATSLKQAKGTGDQMLGILQNTAGVKAEEIAWTGLDEFLKGKKTVTRDEIVDYLRENQVRIEEVTLGKGATQKQKADAEQKVGEAQRALIDAAEDQGMTQVDAMNLPIKIRQGRQLIRELPESLQRAAYTYNNALVDFQEIETTNQTATKFSQYTLPGGENYREVLLTLPSNLDVQYANLERQLKGLPQGSPERAAVREQLANLSDKIGKEKLTGKEQFKSTHFDQPNILAHVRLNDRTDADGKRVLFIEEIQSDWHQAGRKKGYRLSADQEKRRVERLDEIDRDFNDWQKRNPEESAATWRAENPELVAELNELHNAAGNVPDAPFKKNWHEMAFRRVAQMAAQQGYDRVAWTTGEQQNERFDLSKQVDKIAVPMINDGSRSVRVDTPDGKSLKMMVDDKGIVEGYQAASQFTGKPLDEVVGKDMAEKIMKLEQPGEFSGDGLRVGGDGMKGFYDKIIPSYAKKFGKKFGAEVGDTSITTPETVGQNDTLQYEVYDPQGQVYDAFPTLDGAEQAARDNGPGFTVKSPDREKSVKAHSLDITPAMRDAAMKGFELFQDRPSGPRGFISFAENGDTIINLLERADLSTFLHEAGHFWLSTMRDIYADPTAGDQMRQDWAGTKAWWSANAADLMRDIKENNPYRVTKAGDGTFEIHMMGRKVGEFKKQAEADARASALHKDILKTIKSGGGEKWIKAFIESDRQPQNEAETAAFIAMDEYFARGFEAWLLKGDAPSAEVEGLFRAFRAWLGKIYGYATGILKVNVSPEMSAIFDRLVATEAETAAHRDKMPELFGVNQATLEMLNATQREAYIKQQEAQYQAAKEKAFRKAMRQHERKATAWYKEERNRVEEEVEQMARTTPLYRALEMILKGQDAQGNKIEGPHKLDRKAVEAAIGKEGIRFLPKGSTVERGGIQPSIMANMAGFRDTYHMIQAMMGAESFKDYVRNQTDAIMIERHGDMLNDGTVEREALEFLMEEESKAQMIELAALAEKTGAEYPSDGDFKRAAWELIRSQKVDEAIKPHRYLTAALRHARAYGKALGQKDYDAAAEAKRREILNRNLYRFAVQARQDVDKANRRFKDLAKRPKRKKRPVIDPAFHETIQDLLRTVAITPRPSAARATRLEMAAINQWIVELQENEAATLQIPAELQSADGITHYRDMELGEFLGFRDLILNLEKQGRMKMDLLVDGQKRDLAEQAGTGASFILANNKTLDVPIDPQSARNLTPWRAIKSTGTSIMNLSRKIETVIDMLAGGDKEAYEYLWKRIREPIFKAETVERKMQMEAARKLADIQFKHFGKRAIRTDKKTHWVTSEDLISQNTAVYVNQKIGTMRREEIIMVAHNWGNPEGRDRLLNDPVRKWEQEDIDAILRLVRQKDWDYLQDVWDFYDTFWPKVEAAEKARYGYAPKKVEALPIETPYGIYRGGYAPIKYDGMLNARAREQDAEAIAKEFMLGKPLSTNTRNGSTYERQAAVNMSLKLNFGVIQQHIAETIHDLALGDPLREVARFVRHGEMQKAIIETHGMETYEEIMVWLADVAVGGVRATNEFERMAAGLRHTMTMGALGLRVSTVALQVTGISNTIVEVGAPWVARGLARYAKMGGFLGAGEEISKVSEYMRQRPETFNVNIAETINRLRRKGGALEAGQTAMLVPMMRMQYMVDCVTWLGAHEKALSEGKNDADAITAADLSVERAQSGGAMSSLSAIERGTLGEKTRLNELVKSMTWMMSYFNAKFNIAYRKTNAAVKSGDPLKIAGLVGDYAILFWFEFLIGEMLLGRIPDFDDDDNPEGAAMAWMFWGGVGTATAGVGFLRDAVGAIQGFSAAPAYSKGIDQAAKGLTGSAREFYRLATGDEDANVYNLLRKALVTANYISPVKMPTSQINQIIRGIERDEKGEEVGPLDYIVFRER